MPLLYSPLSKGEQSIDDALLQDTHPPHRIRERTGCLSISHLILVSIIALLGIHTLSLSAQLNRLRQSQSQWRNHSVSANVGLGRTVPVPWTGSGDWVNDNSTVEDAAWSRPDLAFDAGVVALPDQWAAERNISLAQRWPWDAQKGIYLLSSTHNIHCLKTIRKALLAGISGQPMGMTKEHAKHCLSQLMQELLCTADDGLQYTGAVHANYGLKRYSAGEGQVRMCRDWNQLRVWATENSACYTTSLAPDQRTVYMNCPDGSRPWEGKL